MLNLTFESLEGTNAGFVNTWAADPSLGEFTVYGWGADDFVCVTAQACDGAACGDAVGPVCVLAGAMDGVQECAEGAGPLGVTLVEACGGCVHHLVPPWVQALGGGRLCTAVASGLI